MRATADDLRRSPRGLRRGLGGVAASARRPGLSAQALADLRADLAALTRADDGTDAPSRLLLELGALIARSASGAGARPADAGRLLQIVQELSGPQAGSAAGTVSAPIIAALTGHPWDLALGDDGMWPDLVAQALGVLLSCRGRPSERVARDRAAWILADARDRRGYPRDPAAVATLRLLAACAAGRPSGAQSIVNRVAAFGVDIAQAAGSRPEAHDLFCRALETVAVGLWDVLRAGP